MQQNDLIMYIKSGGKNRHDTDGIESKTIMGDKKTYR
jgi:hypothetical protein